MAHAEPSECEVPTVTAAAPLVAVEVAYAPRAGTVERVALHLPAGTALIDAVRASGLLERYRLEVAALRCGIWGKPKEPGTVLRERDRVEIYRPLQVDPKESRRLRYRKHFEKYGGKFPPKPTEPQAQG